MSFRCQKCGQSQPVNTRPIAVVVETREKIYPQMHHRGVDGKPFLGPAGHGHETVTELRCCHACATAALESN